MPIDPNQLAQDKDFLALTPKDQVGYLSATDPDFAKLSADDQQGYLQHLTGKPAAVPKTVVAPNNTQSFSDAFGSAKSHGPSDEDLVNAYDAGHPFLGKLARFAVHAGDTAMNIPSSIYHAVTDPSTEEEKKEFPNQIPGEVTMSRLIGANPTATAAADYIKGRVTPKGVTSVLPEALGEGVGNVAGSAFIPKITELAKGAVPSGPPNNVTKNTYAPAGDHIAAALRSNARVDVPAEAATAHPAIEEGLADRGYTTKDFQGRNGPTVLKGGIDNAIDLTEARAKQIIDPIRGEAVDPKILAENPELAARFEGKSKVTYGDLDAERIKMNKELRRANFYAKDPSAQYAAADPLANTEAAVNQARDLVYGKAEQTTGLDLRPLKRTESALIKLGDLAETTKNTLSAKGAVHESTPLLSKAAQSAKSIIAAKANPISAFFSYEKPGLSSPLKDFNMHMQKAFPQLTARAADTTMTFPKYDLRLSNPAGSMYPSPVQQLINLSGGENIPGEDLKLTAPPGETPTPTQPSLFEDPRGHFGERAQPINVPENDLHLTPSGDMPPALQRVLGLENPGVQSPLYPGVTRPRIRAGVKK